MTSSILNESWNVLTSTELGISTYLTIRKRPFKKYIKQEWLQDEALRNSKKYITPRTIGIIYLSFFFLLAKYFWIRFNAGGLNPYAPSLLITRSWGKRSNAFERWFRRTPKYFLVSTALLNFSNMAKTQCWAVNHFWKLSWNLGRNWSIKDVIWWHISLSRILKMTGKILTDR